MSFVEFSLTPLEDIEPWGEPGDLSLSWFGFSLGRYRLRAGESLLLNYSDESVALVGEKYPDTYAGPMVDYQVVRLWEDLIGLMPAVLVQVPTQLEPLAQLSFAEVARWSEAALDNARSEEEEAAVSALSCWHGDHGLDTGYLSPSADISFWRSADFIDVRWDNTGKEIDGVPAWSSLRGAFRMPVSDFVSEIEDFNNRFMRAMAERVRQICSDWSRPDVRVDLGLLQSEQRGRATWFAGERARRHDNLHSDVLAQAEAIFRAVPPSHFTRPRS